MYSFDEQTNNVIILLNIICYRFKGLVLPLNLDL
jgi:hypothetical protein